MFLKDLPPIDPNYHVPIAHFPTLMQGFVFRNWEMVPDYRLAEVLGCDVETVRTLAEDMGLGEQQNTEQWLEKGYITIIRSNWHILPYEQLIQLLDISWERLVYTLREDDFLSCKLGMVKPDCKPVTFQKLTPRQIKQTEQIKKLMQKHIRVFDNEKEILPFDFFKEFYKTDGVNERLAEYDIEVTCRWTVEDNICDELSSLFIERFIADVEAQWGITLKKYDGKGCCGQRLAIELISGDFECEYHEIELTCDKITIKSIDLMGVLRGLNYLLDLAQQNGGMYFKSERKVRTAQFKSRFIYSYCALLGNVFDVDTTVSYPDELLSAYSKVGINGIWTQVVLYTLAPFPFDLSYSKGYEQRIARLKELTLRAKKYGIKIYLYLNEPRGMENSFYDKHPHLRGHKRNNQYAFCTSLPEVREYLAKGVEFVCSEVPELGGFFTITRSENDTNCYSRSDTNTITCPRCKNRTPEQVVAEVNNIIEQAAHKVNPDMDIFAYAWAWEKDGFDLEQCVKMMSEKIIVMNVSENGKKYNIAGISDEIVDYSISIPGPSDRSRYVWDVAKKACHERAAKVQINNSWECSTTPFIPVFKLIEEHINNLCAENIEHIMLSWTLGGWPSPNIKLALAACFYDPDRREAPDYEQIKKVLYFGHYDKIKAASDLFSDAFRNFPFYIRTIYCGPTNSGPANLLYGKATGLSATMTCYAFDDLTKWRSIYPVEIFEKQFSKLCDGWARGIDIIKNLPNSEFKDAAYVCYYIFLSSLNQIRFIRARDNKDGKAAKLIAEQEIEIAAQTYRIMRRNPTIGYEAANHYYFNKSMLMEKIINCYDIIETMPD